jgi:DnaJ like chaperone protein
MIFETFNEQIKKEAQNVADLARVFVSSTPYETRLQVLHFLFGVANADGNVAQSELDKISQIAGCARPAGLPILRASRQCFFKRQTVPIRF